MTFLVLKDLDPNSISNSTKIMIYRLMFSSILKEEMLGTKKRRIKKSILTALHSYANKFDGRSIQEEILNNKIEKHGRFLRDLIAKKYVDLANTNNEQEKHDIIYDALVAFYENPLFKECITNCSTNIRRFNGRLHDDYKTFVVQESIRIMFSTDSIKEYMDEKKGNSWAATIALCNLIEFHTQKKLHPRDFYKITKKGADFISDSSNTSDKIAEEITTAFLDIFGYFPGTYRAIKKWVRKSYDLNFPEQDYNLLKASYFSKKKDDN